MPLDAANDRIVAEGSKEVKRGFLTFAKISSEISSSGRP